MEYKIISDSSCDMDGECAKKYGIEVIPFYVSFDGENYKKEIEEISVRQFYQQMIDTPTLFPKSSLPSTQDYIDAFEPHVKRGEAIICICITTKFSGSYNSALNAKSIIQETYPECKIEIMDSTVDTVLQGIFVREAAKMKADGLSLEENIANLEKIKSTGRIIFTVGGMSYLVHGGRVGKLMGLAASTLGIRPLITLKEGEIFPSGIARSRKKSMARVVDLVKEHFQKSGESPEDYEIVVGYGYDYDEAVEFRDIMIQSINTYSHINSMDIYQIGATIGVHTGPYPIGIGLLRKYNA